MLTTEQRPNSIHWSMWDSAGRPTPHTILRAYGPICPPGFRPGGGIPGHWDRRTQTWDEVVSAMRQVANAETEYQLVGTYPRIYNNDLRDRNVVSEVAVLRRVGLPVQAPDYDAWQASREAGITEFERLLDGLCSGIAETLREQEQRDRLAEWNRNNAQEETD